MIKLVHPETFETREVDDSDKSAEGEIAYRQNLSCLHQQGFRLIGHVNLADIVFELLKRSNELQQMINQE